MTDRGEYRAVRRVLLDGPDFQQLPERARWVFLALKLNFGPAGIEVWYPAELVARIAAQTGASPAGVQDALMHLERGGWIQREGNVVWIIGQLTNDPHVKQADRKHRTMMQRHIAGLPRLEIVAKYVKAHRDWFTVDGTTLGTPSDGLAWAFEGPSGGLRSTKDKPENEPENKPLGSSSDDPEGRTGAFTYPAEFEAMWAVYPPRTGGNSKREAHAAWRARLRAGVPCEVLHAGVVRYDAFCQAEGKRGSRYVMQASSFFGTAEHYLEPWSPAPASDAPGTPAVYATTLWNRYRAHGLLSRPTRGEIDRLAGVFVAAGEYPTEAAFLDELRLTRPWDGLNDARTDQWAVAEITKRLAQPMKVAS